ncbi:MAG: ATP-binding protein, partial [Sphaerochaetaceae bacterium]
NIIYNELRSRGYSVDIGVVKYTKTEDGRRKEKTAEIDFVANRGSRRYYIQSAYNMDDPEKKETEIRPFLKINDSFKKIVVVGGLLSPRRDENGIVTMGIRNFLKDENSLEF